MIQIVIFITGKAILGSNYRLFHFFYFTIIQNTKVWRANWNGRATGRVFVPMPWECPQDKACWPTLFNFFKVAAQCQQRHYTATTCFYIVPLPFATSNAKESPLRPLKSPLPTSFLTSPPQPDQI